MTTLCPISISISPNTSLINPFNRARCYLFTKLHHPIKLSSMKCSKNGAFHQNLSKMSKWDYSNKGFLLGFREKKSGVLWVDEKKIREQRVLTVRFNQGFGSNGGNGGGGKIDGTTARVLVNLVLAVGLTYLTMTGQLGWFLDAIVSLWLIAVIVPILGIGAFLWWAGRDMIIGTCPNCGNAFQVFKSTINDELQLCPYCTQPFSVQGNDFVKEPIKFSKRASSFGEFDDFTPWSRKGKDTSTTVVDVEAEVKDVD